jgi:hypothetical protein
MVSRRLDGRQNGLAGHQQKRSSTAAAISPTLWKGGRTTLWALELCISIRVTRILCSAFMDQSVREHRQGYIVGLHSHDQRGRDRPLQPGENGCDRGGPCAEAKRLVAPGSTKGLECSWRAPAHEETPAPLRPKRSLFPRLW